MKNFTHLIQKTTTGDLQAFAQLVHQFQDIAVGYAYTILNDFHLAEDAAQEAFIDTYRNLSQLKNHNAFPSWFRRIIYKHCDRLTRRQHFRTLPIETAETIPSTNPLPSDLIETQERDHIIHNAIQTLSTNQRNILTLFYISDHSQKEIAAFLDLPLTTVQKRLYDARQNLKRRMLTMTKENIHQNRPSKNETFTQNVLKNALPHYATDNKTETAKKVVEQALTQYDIQYTDIEFSEHILTESYLIHTENRRGKYLLRIHHPISRLVAGIWQKKNVINSELMWIKALRRNTDIAIEKPIPNQSGQYITTVSIQGIQDPLHCTLLQRTKGHHIWPNNLWKQKLFINPQRELQVCTLGSLLAQLHQHSTNWEKPEDFERPKFDWTSLNNELQSLKAAVDDNLISSDDFETLEKVAQQIKNTMDKLGKDPEHWGLIHAGLHETHYLFKGNEARPTDFTYCGFGHYLADIAYTLRHLHHDMHLKKTFINGYLNLRGLPDNYHHDLETLWQTWNIRETAFHASDPREHKYFNPGDIASPKSHQMRFLNGENIVLD